MFDTVWIKFKPRISRRKKDHIQNLMIPFVKKLFTELSFKYVSKWILRLLSLAVFNVICLYSQSGQVMRGTVFDSHKRGNWWLAPSWKLLWRQYDLLHMNPVNPSTSQYWGKKLVQLLGNLPQVNHILDIST